MLLKKKVCGELGVKETFCIINEKKSLTSYYTCCVIHAKISAGEDVKYTMSN